MGEFRARMAGNSDTGAVSLLVVILIAQSRCLLKPRPPARPRCSWRAGSMRWRWPAIYTAAACVDLRPRRSGFLTFRSRAGARARKVRN